MNEITESQALALLRPGEVLDWDITVGGTRAWAAVRCDSAGQIKGKRALGIRGESEHQRLIAEARR